jgi:alpha-galactosidase/6-phospho-beta-glucosidase family protein
VTGETVTFNSLNLINDGLIGELPANVFVETMADVDRSGPKGRLISLPPEVVHHNLLATKINQTLVRAATQRKVSLLNEAVELDPTILDKSRGREALMQCIAAHQDLLPRYD